MTTNEQEWERARRMHPVFGKMSDAGEASSFWMDTADTYGWSRYSEIAAEIVADLRNASVLNVDADVIDIACGPGAYARLIAPLVRSVHCADISPGMIGRLRREMGELGISNYTSEVCDCAEMPEDRRRDVAFVSLCPFFNSPEGIISLERYAEKKCVYIASANTDRTIESEIWHLLGRDCSYSGYDPKYPYEYLKSMGREPVLKYYTQPRIIDESEQECVERLEETFSGYGMDGGDVHSAISEAVHSHSSDGRVRTDATMRLGLLVWTPLH